VHRGLAAAEQAGEDLAERDVDLREGLAEPPARGLVDLVDGALQAVHRIGNVGALGGEEGVALLLLVVLLGGENVDRAEALEDRLGARQLGLELGELGAGDRRYRPVLWDRPGDDLGRGGSVALLVVLALLVALDLVDVVFRGLGVDVSVALLAVAVAVARRGEGELLGLRRTGPGEVGAELLEAWRPR
jgi:hypothetical protein